MTPVAPVGYNRLIVPALKKMLQRSRKLGYALNDTHITPGATSVGLPIRDCFGTPFAAITVGAISSRMTPARQQDIVAILRAEVQALERAASEAARP